MGADLEQHSILLLPQDIEALQSQAARELHDDLRRGWHAKAVMAGVNQARMAKELQRLGPLHHEALGQLVGVVDPWIYEEMRRQHGRGCWQNATFRREFFGENPAAGVRSKSRRVTLRVDGRRQMADGKGADACTVVGDSALSTIRSQPSTGTILCP